MWKDLGTQFFLDLAALPQGAKGSASDRPLLTPLPAPRLLKALSPSIAAACDLNPMVISCQKQRT